MGAGCGGWEGGWIRTHNLVLCCVADLNNNNTEFHCVGGLYTHNMVKPTSQFYLVMVELGFDKI